MSQEWKATAFMGVGNSTDLVMQRSPEGKERMVLNRDGVTIVIAPKAKLKEVEDFIAHLRRFSSFCL